MLKKIVLLFFIIISGLLFITESRAKTYDLGPFLDVDYNRAQLDVAGDKYCIKHQKNNNYYIKTNTADFGPYKSVPRCVATENGVVFYYRDPDNYNSYYVNDKNIVSGPYKINQEIVATEKYVMFKYRNSEDTGDLININNQTYGPYNSVSKFAVGKNTWLFSYMTENDNYNNIKKYIKINDKDYGPYDRTGNVVAFNDNWAYEYEKDGKSYINIKDQILEKTWTFDFNHNFKLGDDGWILYYKEDDKSYVKVNGATYGPYENISNIEIINKSHWGFVYLDSIKNYYVMVDGETFGPFDSNFGFALSGDNWGIITNTADTEEIASLYLYVDNKLVGGYDNILESPRSLPLSSGKKIMVFKARKNDRYYFIDSHYEIGPFEKVGDNYNSPTGWAFSYEKDNNMYLKIIEGEYDGIEKKSLDTVIREGKQLTISDIIAEYNPAKRWLVVRWKTDKEAVGWLNCSIMDYNIYSGKLGSCYKESGFSKDHMAIINSVDDDHGAVYEINSEDRDGNRDGSAYKMFIVSDPNTYILITDNKEIDGVENRIMYNRLKGKIILKVEDAGEAYYINPKTETMHYLGRPADAFQVMREQGVGITNSNLFKIPVGMSNLTGPDSDQDGLPDLFEDAVGSDKNNQDTDNDGYSDKAELDNGYNPVGSGKIDLDNNFSNNQKGKIFLQVEGNGESWYISPDDGKRYFLGRPGDAFNVMRNLGLGISNSDFEKL